MRKKAAKSSKPTTIDEYIRLFPDDVQVILQKLRQTIRKAAPAATEAISYQIAAFKMGGALIYFAGYTKHVGVYPVTAGLEKALKKEIAPYRSGKGTLRFPLDQPIPYGLVTKIVKVRVAEMADNKKGKKKI